MTTNIQIAYCAKTWIGTPFQYQGRIKNVGCDCLGLIIGVSKEMNLFSKQDIPIFLHDASNYSMDPDTGHLERVLDEILWPSNVIEPGFICVLHFDSNPKHLGIVGPNSDTLIHADISHRKVIESRLDGYYGDKITRIYSLINNEV